MSVSGLVTSFLVDPQQCWMAVGTSNGSHVCWDLRFQLPITTIQHPTGNVILGLVMDLMFAGISDFNFLLQLSSILQVMLSWV